MTSVEGLSDGAVLPAQCHRSFKYRPRYRAGYGPRGAPTPLGGDSLLVTPSSSNGLVLVNSHLIASVSWLFSSVVNVHISV